MIKRLFDIILSLTLLLIASPFLILIALIIFLTSKEPIFFIQSRVGLNNKDFNIFKFNSMCVGSEKEGSLTLGNSDPRITKTGYFLRKYKLDELPQLLNIIKGDMSFVGPRPELRKYVSLYKHEYSKILTVKPGITSLASIKYRNEVEILKNNLDPENFYINTILPEKIKLEADSLKKQSLFSDLKIIFKTLKVVIFNN